MSDNTRRRRSRLGGFLGRRVRAVVWRAAPVALRVVTGVFFFALVFFPAVACLAVVGFFFRAGFRVARAIFRPGALRAVLRATFERGVRFFLVVAVFLALRAFVTAFALPSRRDLALDLARDFAISGSFQI